MLAAKTPMAQRRSAFRVCTWGGAPISRAAVPTVLIGLVVAGCGGSSASKSSTHAQTTPKKVKHHAHAAPKVLTETVRSSSATAAWAAKLDVRPGETLVMRTIVPGKHGSGPAKVTLIISQQAGGVSIQASANGQKSTAVINGVSGKQATLVGVHYGCFLPPVPSFCPAVSQSHGKDSTKLVFSVRPPTPILVGATVGPTTTKLPAALPPGSGVVPAYKAHASVKIVPASKSGKPIPPASTVAVKAGQIVALRTRLTSRLMGAPQLVTISFSQGPGATLHLTSTVAGGVPSTATVKSANGSPIALVLPRFVCFLPPVGTFCPASKIQVSGGHVTLQFHASPTTPPIDVVAKVQAA